MSWVDLVLFLSLELSLAEARVSGGKVIGAGSTRTNSSYVLSPVAGDMGMLILLLPVLAFLIPYALSQLCERNQISWTAVSSAVWAFEVV